MGTCIPISRREFLTAAAVLGTAACSSSIAAKKPVAVWGGEGLRDGRFMRPRAIDAYQDEIYVVDTTGRVQVFDSNGNFARMWKIPEQDNGTPTAIIHTLDGRIVIPDTHNSRILEYTPEGKLLSQWGSYGSGTNEFIYPTGIALSKEGTYFISEYGENAERVHVFDDSHKYQHHWGSLGDEPGNFSRAMDIAINSNGQVLVADTTNHRIQIFDQDGTLHSTFGSSGTEPGKLKFPYDIAVTKEDTVVICEYGNNRITHMTQDGKFLGAIGSAGRAPGQLNSPRGIAVTDSGKLYVADTDNHRIQEFRLEDLS